MNCNESESGKSQATNTDTTIPKEVVIPVDQIEIVDADRLREDDDPKTISEYRETYLMYKNDDGSFNDPFPPCGGFINESGKFAVTAGRHRIIAGREVGVKEFRCIVFPDKESGLWHGLGDNCKNGLRNRPGDLQKMIEIALLNFAESNRAIAEHIGCSPSWVNKISKQVRTRFCPTNINWSMPRVKVMLFYRFSEGETDGTTCIDRRRMEADRTAVATANGRKRTPLGRSPANNQRHALDREDWSPLA